MRRVGNLWPSIVAFDNLLRAARVAARGKRRSVAALRFLERLEPEVLALQRELEAGSYRPGPTITFQILDPKARTIAVSPFRDRVVHHALVDPLEPIFERRMIADSYACRRGKGTHAALRRAQEFLRRYEYFLKLDVEHFFETVSHDVALDTLARIIKDRNVLDLLEKIVRTHIVPGHGGRAIPIGALTSQWIANLVLDRLDHHVKEKLRTPAYLRYMDDFVLFAHGKARLSDARREVEDYLGDTLRLRLKEKATILAPAWQGLPFLGFRLYRGLVRVRPENARRSRARIAHREGQFRRGEIDETQLAGAVRSVVAHLDHGTTRALRRRWFEPIEEGKRARDSPGV
ncbi:MAG: group II intron reverse transcriptase domain-containing protein [Planctomycetes bacterium]|nr:group II intron reverse transcriptase domain-containing protein [Planctomycetota bacterium]